MTPSWRAALAALPREERERFAAEADALHASGSRQARVKAIEAWLALEADLDPSSARDAPRASSLLLGVPPGYADLRAFALRCEREGTVEVRRAATIHLGRAAADAGDLPGAEARFRSVLAAVRGGGGLLEFFACSSLASLFLRQGREYESLILSRRLVSMAGAPPLDEPTRVRYALLCLAESLERLGEWTLLREALGALDRSLAGVPPGQERTVRIFALFAEARAALAEGDPGAAERALDAAGAAVRGGTSVASEERALAALRGRAAMARARWEEGAAHLERALAVRAPSRAGVLAVLAHLVRCRARLGGPAAALRAAGALLEVLEEEGTRAHGSGDVLAAVSLALEDLGTEAADSAERAGLLRAGAGAALLRVLEIDRCVRELPEIAAAEPGDERLLREHRARFWRSHDELLGRVRTLIAEERRAGRLPLARLRRGDGPLRACAWCVRLLAPDGEWIPVAHLLPRGLDFPVTHGICPRCAGEHFPGFAGGAGGEGR